MLSKNKYVNYERCQISSIVALIDYNSKRPMCVHNYGLLLMWHDHLFALLIPSNINKSSATVKDLDFSGTYKHLWERKSQANRNGFEKSM